MFQWLKKSIAKPNLKENSNENTFHPVNPVYTEKPIPEEYLFPEYQEFLTPYPNVHDILQEEFKDILVSNFVDSVNQIKAKISKFESDLLDENQFLDSIQSMPKFQIQIREYTTDLQRKYAVILPHLLKLSRSIIISQIDLLNSRISILKQLQELAMYLAEHPGPYYINLKTALIEPSDFQFGKMNFFFIRERAFQLLAQEIYTEISMIPPRFNGSNTDSMIIRSIFSKEAQSFSTHHYIPISDAYYIFEDYFKSKIAPFNIVSICANYYTILDSNKTPKFQFRKETLPYLIQDITKMVEEFVGLDFPARYIAVPYCAHFVFNLFCVYDRTSTPVGNLSEKLYKLSSLSPKELGINQFFSEEELDKPISTLRSENETLKNLVEKIRTVMFYNDPVEVAAVFYEIHKEVENNDGWKAVIVSADISDPENLYGFPFQWCKLPAMPRIFLPAIEAVVSNVIKLRALAKSLFSYE